MHNGVLEHSRWQMKRTVCKVIVKKMILMSPTDVFRVYISEEVDLVHNGVG